MARAATSLWRKTMRQEIDPSGILNALPDPVLVIGGRNEILYVNLEAQEFFDSGAAALVGLPLTELLPADSPVYFLIEQARVSGASMSEYGVTLDTPRIGVHLSPCAWRRWASRRIASSCPCMRSRSPARSTTSSPTAMPPAR